MKTNRLNANDADFVPRLMALTAWSEERDEEVGERVRGILRDVAGRGDAAVVEYTNRFDRRDATSMADLTVERAQLEAALERLPAEQRQALEAAAERVSDYHARQKQDSWHYRDAHGTLLGQQVTPLDRAGIYVPGGKAAYPSSVLMNALPARVAGVAEIVMVSPAPDGELNDMVLAAAAVAGVERFFTLGGAQAVGALAFGTETVPAVDKIVGPGNIYVAEAKRQVFGKVGIDMIAGPSEILVVCDGKTDPDWIAMDLFSQAEHDEEAQSILVSPDADFLARVEEAMERLAPTLEREAVIRTSMANRGALIQVDDL
ncbi:MAG TPA: histidinol dehydrogenase, partial [Alcanivorax sp.]|nr:histidinol dehydrogenase [Alcanivorax sp.]